MRETQTDPALTLEQRAAQFADAWHGAINQKRHFTGLPYISHCAAVVEILRTVSDDQVLLAGAWMHDLVEDTPCTLIDVEAEFGAEVADLVKEVTNVSTKRDGLRAQRRAIDRAHVAKASVRGKTLKLADIIHNVTDAALTAPTDFATLYAGEKRLMLEVLREGNAVLFKRAEATLNWADEVLGIQSVRAG